MRYKHLKIEIETAGLFKPSRTAAAPVVAVLSLNRPEVRNAMDENTLREISAAFKSFAGTPGLRAVVVRGEGKDFCAGADIKWMRRSGTLKGAAAKADAKRLVDMCRAVSECPVPVVARVHRSIFGGGLGLISACDIVVAEENSRMCFSECRLGILPAVVSSFVLPKIGPSAARRYFLTAEVFGMVEALRMGIVHEVVAEADLDKTVDRILSQILKNGPRAVREAKALIRKFEGLSFPKRVAYSLKTLLKVRSSAEGQEGLGAFLEKRPPRWTVDRPEPT